MRLVRFEQVLSQNYSWIIFTFILKYGKYLFHHWFIKFKFMIFLFLVRDFICFGQYCNQSWFLKDYVNDILVTWIVFY